MVIFTELGLESRGVISEVWSFVLYGGGKIIVKGFLKSSSWNLILRWTFHRSNLLYTMHGFARNSFKTIDIRVRQSTGTLMMHSYMVSELFLEQARTPVWKRSWRNLQIQGGVLGEPWKRGGVKKVFLLKQSVKTIETKLQKTLYLFHMISASQGKTVTDFQSSILASAFIMQLKNRNIKVNSIIVFLKDFQWKMSIILPNPASDKCTIKFISRKKFVFIDELACCFYILKNPYIPT